MKKEICLLLAMGCLLHAQAQLKLKPKCDNFYVDVLNGTVNGVHPDFTMGQIKDKLPCFTSSDAESAAASSCGATVFFADRDVYFYVDRDYIEVKNKFKGTMSIPLLGTARSSLFKWLGHPKMKDDTWDAFETAYGLLVLHYNKANKVDHLEMTTKSTETLNLCE